MGEVAGRVLIGLLLLMLLGWLGPLVLSIFTGIVNGLAYASARLIRRIFGIRGRWERGATLAMLGVVIGKAVASLLFSVSLLWYALLYPYGAWVFEGAASFAILALFMVWMPAVFFFGLFAAPDSHE